MKKIILLSCLLFLSNLHSQELTCEQKVKKFLIDKIKKYKSNELIPYYSKKENKWGFFDIKSKIKVTKPIFNDGYFFNPSLYIYYGLNTNGKENGCDGKISGSNSGYKIISLKESIYELFSSDSAPTFIIDYSNYIDNSTSGFEVNNNNKIIKFNSKFYNNETTKPIDLDPIYLKGNFYTVINYKIKDISTFSIINQSGETVSGFENSSKNLYPINSFSDSDDVLILIPNLNNTYKLKSLLKNLDLIENINDSFIGDNNIKKLGYSLLKVNNEMGIFDFTTMNWKIKPDSKNDFSVLYYSSLEEITKQDTIKGVIENRKKVKIFIQNSKNEFYDLDMKLYKPKN